MKNNYCSLKILGQLKRKINVNRYIMNDFYLACPYSIEELKSRKRKQSLVSWRQIGLSWAFLSGLKLNQSGKLFNRNHATVIHSLKIVRDSLNGYQKSEIIDFIKIIEILEKDPIIISIPYENYVQFLKDNFMNNENCEAMAKSTYEFLPFLKLK